MVDNGWPDLQQNKKETERCEQVGSVHRKRLPCVCMCVCEYVHVRAGTCKVQRMVSGMSDSLELEFQVVLTVGARN